VKPPAAGRGRVSSGRGGAPLVGVSSMTSRSARYRRGGPAVWLTALVAAAGLSGCGPIEVYRSVVGFSKNDPDPATAPFSQNLVAASDQPFPNLASVPPPPIVATTAGERAKIAAALDQQRASTQALDAQGHPGAPAPGPVPPPPPIPPALLSSQVAAAPQPAPPPLRPENEPPPVGSLESTLQSPTVSAAPPGLEPTRPAPPQAAMQSIPRPAPSSLSPEVAQSGNPQPSPPQPVLPPPQPSPQAAAMPPPRLPPAPLTTASLDVPPGAAALTVADEARLADVVAQAKQKQGIVRVVAYAAAAVGGAEQLNSFRAALDRAQLVANALGEAGVPAKQIQTEAAPATPAAPVGRVEIQLLPPAPPAPGAKG